MLISCMANSKMLKYANVSSCLFTSDHILKKVVLLFFSRIYDQVAYNHVFAVLKGLKYFAQVVPVRNNKTGDRL